MAVAGGSDWHDHNRQLAVNTRDILERTGHSIQRSHQIALETEAIGTEVISELNDQRETLLRAKDRLEDADEQLDSSRKILRRIKRNVLYNKFILVLIIVLELVILGSLCYIKFK